MLRLRPAVTSLLLASWLALAAAPFCQAVAGESMPCCKKAGACAEGLGKPGCCRVAPGDSSPRAAGDALPTSKKLQSSPSPATAPFVATLPLPLAATRTEWVTRHPDDHTAVPLYLLNASILR
ncbi:MAG: hypothetical protein ACRD6R_14620 [Candidatus Polarisedimenticolia bacterium]